MSYATVDDLTKRCGEEELIQLTDTTNAPPAEIDRAAVQAKLNDADARINGYLASRMTTPVSPVPLSVQAAACKLTRYFLYKDIAPQRVKDDYDETIAWLKDVAAGISSLGDETAATPAPSAGTPQVSAPVRNFTKDTLRGL